MGLDRVTEASKNARKIFQVMLLACLYAIITIATTNDVNLLTNSASSPLPIIGAKISIVGFYWAAPIFLFGVYVYFHLYLQRLWEELAFQPAIFPDGKRLDEKVYPWLLNGLVYSNVNYLKDKRPQLSGLQGFISILLAWEAVPITLGFFWGRYLTRHDYWLTSLHIILMLVSICFRILSYSLFTATFRGESVHGREALKYGWAFKYNRLILTIVIFLIPFYSFVAINAVYPEPLKFLFHTTRADFVEADVSIKPENWTGKKDKKEEEIALVKGARLRGRNLQLARAYRAFLVKADLQFANLKRADLEMADLRGANLRHANLQGANLYRTNLEGADLAGLRVGEFKVGSTLQGGANLSGANLQSSKLQGAYLQGANLKEAKLQRADLQRANLQGTHLEGAVLTRAEGLSKEQIESAYIDDKTKLPDYLQEHFRKQQ